MSDKSFHFESQNTDFIHHSDFQDVSNYYPEENEDDLLDNYDPEGARYDADSSEQTAAQEIIDHPPPSFSESVGIPATQPAQEAGPASEAGPESYAYRPSPHHGEVEVGATHVGSGPLYPRLSDGQPPATETTESFAAPPRPTEQYMHDVQDLRQAPGAVSIGAHFPPAGPMAPIGLTQPGHSNTFQSVTVTDPVTMPDHFSPYTQYTVTSNALSGDVYTVKRRFSDFDKLCNIMHQIYPTVVVPPCPAKKMVGRLEGDFIDSRRMALEDMLRRILQHPVLSRSEALARFLRAETIADVERLPAELRAAAAAEGEIVSIGAGGANPGTRSRRDSVASTHSVASQYSLAYGRPSSGSFKADANVRASWIGRLMDTLELGDLGVIISPPVDPDPWFSNMAARLDMLEVDLEQVASTAERSRSAWLALGFSLDGYWDAVDMLGPHTAFFTGPGQTADISSFDAGSEFGGSIGASASSDMMASGGAAPSSLGKSPAAGAASLPLHQHATQTGELPIFDTLKRQVAFQRSVDSHALQSSMDSLDIVSLGIVDVHLRYISSVRRVLVSRQSALNRWGSLQRQLLSISEQLDKQLANNPGSRSVPRLRSELTLVQSSILATRYAFEVDCVLARREIEDWLRQMYVDVRILTNRLSQLTTQSWAQMEGLFLSLGTRRPAGPPAVSEATPAALSPQVESTPKATHDQKVVL